MPNTIKIKRRLSTSPLGAGAPAGLEAGELFVNFVDKRIYAKGDLANPLEFADKDYVDSAISAGTGSLGTMSTQNADSVAITGGSVTATLDANNQPISNVHAPIDDTDAATKGYVDGKISDLGSVFHFIGDISAATSNDLTTLADQTTGAYYRVDVEGTYTAGASSFALKVGDAIVKTTSGWQKLDNVDAVVLGTNTEIAVTGDEEAGYTVALASEFKQRVSDVESKTQNIDLAATTAGQTKINGNIEVEGTGDAATFKGNVYVEGSDGNLYVEKTLNVGPFGSEVFKVDPDNANAAVTVGLSYNPVAAADLGAGTFNIQRLKVGLALDGSILDANENEVKVGKNFTVNPGGMGPMLDVTEQSLGLNMNGGTPTVTSWGTFETKTAFGESYAGDPTGTVKIGFKTDGAIVCNAATPTAIDGFVIDGGEY